MSPRRPDGRPTARELEVLELLCRPGAKRSSVAEKLGISEFTVDSHLRSLYRRLGVTSAAQALVLVRRSRLAVTAIVPPVEVEGARPLSLTTRFEVFKRDRFTCSYCGRTPPEAVLQIDHVIPRADGGSDKMDNLTTSCQDCNLGKGDRPLDAAASLSR